MAYLGKLGSEPKTTEKNYLNDYLKFAPVSLALVRAVECRCLSELEFKHPILDVGCGDGLFASVFFEAQVEQGMDTSPVEAASARKTGAYQNVVVANAVNIPFKDESFTTVFSNCVLEHIPQVNNVLREISRVLKKEGKLIFTVPSDLVGERLFYSSLLKRIGLNRLGDLYSQKLNSVFRHYNLYSPSIWDKKLEVAGLKRVSCERYLSPGATKAYDIMLICSLASLLSKKLFKKWVLFPRFRKLMVVPILFFVFRRFYEPSPENGSSLLIVAAK